MNRECAWCGAVLGPPTPDGDKNAVTHGICETCRKDVLEEMGATFRQFLDSLDEPVLVLDKDGALVTANEQAAESMNGKRSELEGTPFGVFLECPHSREPDGCGGTTHCLGCTIRRTVETCYRTGRSFERIKAYPDIQYGDDDHTLCLEVSVEKVGDHILLRIDDREQRAGSPDSAPP